MLGSSNGLMLKCGTTIINIFNVKMDIPLITPHGTTTSCKVVDTLHANNVNPCGTTNYLWSSGATSECVTVSAGTYTVTISNACDTVVGTLVRNYSNTNSTHISGNPNVCYGTLNPLNATVSGIATYFWSTTATTPVIQADTTGDYAVTVTNQNGCNSSDQIHVTAAAPPEEPICYTTFDTLSWGNAVYTPTNLTANVDSFRIYREVSTNVYASIGHVAAATGKFTDTMGCFPQSQSYSYKIAAVDTCGNVGVMSSAHTTITLLATYDQGTDTYGFTWSAYIGLPVGNYDLYGIDSTNHTIHLIGSVPGTQYFYNYIHPNLSYIKYYVAFAAPSCSSKTLTQVKSNWLQSVLTGIHEYNTLTLSLYPNPTTGQFTITGLTGNYTINVYDLTGRLILQVKDQNTINLGDFCSGIYIIKAITKNGVYTGKVTRQ